MPDGTMNCKDLMAIENPKKPITTVHLVYLSLVLFYDRTQMVVDERWRDEWWSFNLAVNMEHSFSSLLSPVKKYSNAVLT